MDPGLIVTSSHGMERHIYTGLIVHSWGVPVPLVVSLWGVINALYAIITVASSIICPLKQVKTVSPSTIHNLLYAISKLRHPLRCSTSLLYAISKLIFV